MLYFFYGDLKKSNEKASVLIKKMLEKKPDVSLFVIDEDNLNEGILQEMTQSSMLFQSKYIVRVKESGTKNQESVVMDFLKEMKESENIFIWNEGKVNKGDLKKIEKYAEKIVEAGSRELGVGSRDNKIFEICNPIINKDKKLLWVKYQELLEIYPPEEIHGTMFWQFKNIAIASKTNLKDSGLAPYPYQNANKALNNYSAEEVLEKTSELARIVHEARSGGVELLIALEKFILNIQK